MDLARFKLRMAERAGAVLVDLSKSTHPDDFQGILRESSPKGAEQVDYLPDLTAHPMNHEQKVQHYRNVIGGESPMIRRTPHALVGVTAKTVYTLPTANNMTNPDKVMVKPYHEAVDPRVKFWQAHHIQGWAEMTNQALWHAAGMGHMHQKVHVSEHNMGPGNERMPALAVHMDPRANFVYNMGVTDYDPAMHEDLPQIAAMDFLSNNIDRHQANLMYLPKDARDERGDPYASRLLAIDHGRSFQYHAAAKQTPRYARDPLLGTLAVDSDIRNELDTEAKQKDNLLNYAMSPAMRSVEQYGLLFGHKPIGSPNVIIPAIAKWWPNVRDNVIHTMGIRLDSIRDPRLRQHLDENFMERVGLLDKIAANPEWFRKQATVNDLEVPMHLYEREE